MKCSEAFDYLKEKFGEDIDSTVYQDIRKHMNECDDCQIYYDSVKKAVMLCKSCEEPKKVPKSVLVVPIWYLS